MHLSPPKWATLVWFHRTAPGNDLETASDTKCNYPCTNRNILILSNNTSTSRTATVIKFVQFKVLGISIYPSTHLSIRLFCLSSFVTYGNLLRVVFD